MSTTDTAINPLLDFSGLPRFDAITPAHVVPAVDELVDAARKAIETVVADPHPATWDTVAEPLAGPLDRLDRAWGAVQHISTRS